MKPVNTQWQDMLDLLRAGPVTPLKALVEIGVFQPADPVRILRRKGYQIETRMVDYTTTRGREVKFAQYHLIAEPPDPADDNAECEPGEMPLEQARAEENRWLDRQRMP